jgi:hypothetical protein
VILSGNLIVAPLGAVLALLWAWRSRTPWREIGYVWPSNWVIALSVAVTFGIALKFLMKAVVMPLLRASHQSGIPLPGRELCRHSRGVVPHDRRCGL